MQDDQLASGLIILRLKLNIETERKMTRLFWHGTDKSVRQLKG